MFLGSTRTWFLGGFRFLVFSAQSGLERNCFFRCFFSQLFRQFLHRLIVNFEELFCNLPAVSAESLCKSLCVLKTSAWTSGVSLIFKVACVFHCPPWLFIYQLIVAELYFDIYSRVLMLWSFLLAGFRIFVLCFHFAVSLRILWRKSIMEWPNAFSVVFLLAGRNLLPPCFGS